MFYIKVMTEKVPLPIRLLCKASINGVGDSCAFSPRITAGSIVKPIFDAAQVFPLVRTLMKGEVERVSALNSSQFRAGLSSSDFQGLWLSQIVIFVLMLLYKLRCKTYEFRIQWSFLGVFTKWRKVAISFVMSVHQHGKTRLQLDGFS